MVLSDAVSDGDWDQGCHTAAWSREFSLPIGQGMVGKVMLSAVLSPAQSTLFQGSYMCLPMSPAVGLFVPASLLCHGHPP